MALVDIGLPQPAVQARPGDPQVRSDPRDRFLPQPGQFDSTTAELGWVGSGHPGLLPGRHRRLRPRCPGKRVRLQELDALSRELGVTAATLAQWRERFLAAGQASLKSRPADDRDEEIRRLQAKVGAITMDNELLLERARTAEAGLPLARRRSRR